MFPLKDIRTHLTNKLDTDIGVLKKNRSSELVIFETKKDDDGQGIHLEEIIIKNLPTEGNVWIFDNEFSDRKSNEFKQKNHQKNEECSLVINQSGAFSSAGKRVETTIIYHKDNKLYLIMIEMKRTISPRKYRKDIAKKFEHSLSTLSIFISAHFHFPSLEQASIFPIGVCCYNYYKDTPDDDRDPKSIGGLFRNQYSEGKRKMNLNVEPISLNRLRIPILLIENPNDPKSSAFDIDFNSIF